MSSLHYDAKVRPKSTPINAEQVYLEGNCIVVPDGYVFPQVCLVTGQEVATPPVEFRFARTKYVSEADMTPGNLQAIFAGYERSHFGPKSKVSFCLSGKMATRRRNLTFGSIVSLAAALPLPIAVSLTTENAWWLVLIFVLIAIAGLCLWLRDRMLRTAKVTPSFIWLAGVNQSVRETIYEAGCRKGKL